MLFLFSIGLADDLLGSSSTEVHINADCDIGRPYDIWTRNCQKSPPIDLPGACTEDDDIDVNCIVQTDGNGQSGWSDYKKKTVTNSEMSELMEVAVTAEGTGWGVSISASTDYMQSHSKTSHSVTFWVGKSGDAYSEEFQNVGKIELTSVAAQILALDWRAFINGYGTHYVSKVIYSTQFIGSAQITSTEESTKSSLDVSASMSYSGFFSASGTAEFSEATEGSNGELKTEVNAFYYGKSVKMTSDKTSDEVDNLMLEFNAWEDNVIANPKENSVPTRMVFRSWYDLEAVQQVIVDNYSSNITELVEIQTAFQTDEIAPQTMSTITEDYIWAKAQWNTLEMYQGYDCVKTMGLDDKVKDYIDTLNTHIDAIEVLTGDDLQIRQAEILAGDYTWFIGRSLEFSDEIDEILEACPMPTAQPTATQDCPTVSIKGYCGPSYDDQVCTTWYNSAHRYCNTGTGKCEKTTDNRKSGQETTYDENALTTSCDPYHRAYTETTCTDMDPTYPYKGPDPLFHSSYPVCFTTRAYARKRTYTCGKWCCVPGYESRCAKFGCSSWITCGESSTSLTSVEELEALPLSSTATTAEPGRTTESGRVSTAANDEHTTSSLAQRLSAHRVE